jgi:hypothetical protein
MTMVIVPAARAAAVTCTTQNAPKFPRSSARRTHSTFEGLCPNWRYSVIQELDDVACTEKLYTLLVIFLASKHIGDLCELAPDGNGGIFRQVLDQHEMSLATHLLIECAVLIRMKDDVFQEQHGMPAEIEKDIVGTLFTGPDLSEKVLGVGVRRIGSVAALEAWIAILHAGE